MTWFSEQVKLRNFVSALKGKVKDKKVPTYQKDKKVGISPNIRTTVSNIESRSSLAAACAFPVGAITGDTGLTAKRVPDRDIPFWRLCLGNWKLFNCPFIKWRPAVAVRSPCTMPYLEELTSSAWALILNVIISWIVGRNLWLFQNKIRKFVIIMNILGKKINITSKNLKRQIHMVKVFRTSFLCIQDN